MKIYEYAIELCCVFYIEEIFYHYAVINAYCYERNKPCLYYYYYVLLSIGLCGKIPILHVLHLIRGKHYSNNTANFTDP